MVNFCAIMGTSLFLFLVRGEIFGSLPGQSPAETIFEMNLPLPPMLVVDDDKNKKK